MTKLQRRYASLPPPLKQLWDAGQAVDVSVLEKCGDSYILPQYDPSKTYIDAFWGAFVTRIVRLERGVGVRREDGAVRLLPAGTVLAGW